MQWTWGNDTQISKMSLWRNVNQYSGLSPNFAHDWWAPDETCPHGVVTLLFIVPYCYALSPLHMRAPNSVNQVISWEVSFIHLHAAKIHPVKAQPQNTLRAWSAAWAATKEGTEGNRFHCTLKQYWMSKQRACFMDNLQVSQSVQHHWASTWHTIMEELWATY